MTHPQSITEFATSRFWNKVDKSSSPHGCWLKLGKPFSTGYGAFWFSGQNVGAHRFSWEIHFGPIPEGMMVLHNCPGGDNRLCVNPDHLWLGTHEDNMVDMTAKGRAATGDRHRSRLYPDTLPRGDEHYARKEPERLPRGSQHGNAKLTDDDVREIRRQAECGALFTEIAARFGMHDSSIRDIVRRETWKHVA